MKFISTYTFLVAWMGYFFVGMHQPKESLFLHNESVCSVEEQSQKDSHSCCEKDADAQIPKEPCQKNHEAKNDCCGQTGCSRICCHIAIASVPAPGEFNYFLASISRSFMDTGHDNLPEPFIGRIYPPPNA